MTRQELEQTEWAKEFLAEAPDYERAIQYALQEPLLVELIHTDENNDAWEWAIVVKGTDFWMDAKPTKEEAIELIKQMGWLYVLTP